MSVHKEMRHGSGWSTSTMDWMLARRADMVDWMEIRRAEAADLTMASLMEIKCAISLSSFVKRSLRLLIPEIF